MRLSKFNLGIYDLRATSSICIQILSALQFSCETQTRRSHSSIPFIKIHVSVPARKEASVSPPLDKLQVTLIRKDDKTWHHIFVNPLITLIFTRSWKLCQQPLAVLQKIWQNIHRLAAETSSLNSWSWGIYIAWRASSGCRLRQMLSVLQNTPHHSRSCRWKSRFYFSCCQKLNSGSSNTRIGPPPWMHGEEKSLTSNINQNVEGTQMWCNECQKWTGIKKKKHIMCYPQVRAGKLCTAASNLSVDGMPGVTPKLMMVLLLLHGACWNQRHPS